MLAPERLAVVGVQYSLVAVDVRSESPDVEERGLERLCDHLEAFGHRAPVVEHLAAAQRVLAGRTFAAAQRRQVEEAARLAGRRCGRE